MRQAIAAAEPLAGGPALVEDDLVGLGDVEGLVVHLGLRQFEPLGQALGDRVLGQSDASAVLGLPSAR